jgi:hypothetical protein
MKSLFAVCLATVYGLLMRLTFGYVDWFSVMSLAFIFIVPLGIGALTVRFSAQDRIKSRVYSFFMPWLSSLALLAVTIAVAIEGTICWVMAYPVFAIAAGIGGLLTRSFLLRQKRQMEEYIDEKTLDGGKDFQNKGNLQVSVLLLLPFLAALVERTIEFQPQVFTASNFIDIQAVDTIVWSNVTRVRDISAAEDRSGINRLLGMPRPIRAELDTLAVGGRREAIFERGLVFHETVFEYEPLRCMAFSIKANPEEIPPTAMDKHVVVGGEYFDVLEGRYLLEPLGNGRCRLHLSSRFVVSTSFNFYSGLWARWIMSDVQENILQVIKRRSEREYLSVQTVNKI